MGEMGKGAARVKSEEWVMLEVSRGILIAYPPPCPLNHGGVLARRPEHTPPPPRRRVRGQLAQTVENAIGLLRTEAPTGRLYEEWWGADADGRRASEAKSEWSERDECGSVG